MNRVWTVDGPLDPRELGLTMVHEHLAIDLSLIKNDPDAVLMDVDAVSREVSLYQQAGGRTMVEVTNRGMGRDVGKLRAIARRTGVHLVAATGYYHGPWLPPEVYQLDVEGLAEIMEREILEGIDGTEVRAGIIAEIGTSSGQILPAEEKVLRAAARAHRRTGAPISTHCSLGTMANEQVDILETEGVDPIRVAIGHLDLVDNIEYHAEVAQRGVFVQYDTVGKNRYQPDEVRIRLILEMLDRGFAEQLMLSCDITRPSYLKSSGGHGYDYLLTRFIPRLKAAGVDQKSLKVILEENPAKFLPF